jgi:MFS family permease
VTETTTTLSVRDRTVIAVLLVSTFVVILNETIMSVALPVLLTDLDVTASVGQWLTGGFLLTMSVVIPITGFLIRRVSTRMLYSAAMGLFSLGTLVAALAPGFGMLMVARVVQAGGTSIMLPLLMTTVMTLVPPVRRGAIMGNISIVIAVAPAVGPTVSGLVLSVLGRRFMFWLVLPIALVTLVLGLRRIVDIGEPTDTRIDVVSVLLSVAGFGGLVYGLSGIGQAATDEVVPVWVPFLVGALGLVAFVLRQIRLQRTDSALLDLRTFRARTFTTASVLMMLMMATLLGTIVLLPIYVQTVLGLDPLGTGLLLLPGGLLMGLLGPVVGVLGARCWGRGVVRGVSCQWCWGGAGWGHALAVACPRPATRRSAAACGGAAGAGAVVPRRGAGGRGLVAAGRRVAVGLGRAVQQGAGPPRLAGDDHPHRVRRAGRHRAGPLRRHRGAAGRGRSGGRALGGRPPDRAHPDALRDRGSAAEVPAGDRRG